MQAQIDALTAESRSSTERLLRAESLGQQLSARLASTDADLAQAREVAAAMREDNKRLDDAKHQLEKQVNQLQIKIAALEQQVAAKDDANARLEALVSASAAQQRSAEELLASVRLTAQKLEEKVKGLSGEVVKVLIGLMVGGD